MPSKQVTDREKSARALIAAAETHAEEIASGLKRELSPYLKAGEEMPDVALLARLLGRKTGAAFASLANADQAHERELSDDAAPREARDLAGQKVRAVLVDLRAAVDAAYGPTALTQLGLDIAVPVDASVLATTGETVLGALEDTSIKLPKPRRAAMKIDRKGFAEDLKAELPALKKALAKVTTEEREKEATQRTKNEAMAKSDEAFSTSASFLAASCEAAGLSELAAKVRPSRRRAGQRTIDEDDADAGDAANEEGAPSPPADGQ